MAYTILGTVDTDLLDEPDRIVGRTSDLQQPTFRAVFDRVVPANGKYMATLFNQAPGRKVVVGRIFAYDWQTASVVGAIADQELRRISARTVGVAVPIVPHDTQDVLTAGIAADTNSTLVTASDLLDRFILPAEEIKLGVAADLLSTLRSTANGALQYDRRNHTKGIVLREGEGLTVQNVNAVTVGSISYVLEFTDEVA